MHIPYNLRTMWGKVGVPWEQIDRGLVQSGIATEVSRKNNIYTETCRRGAKTYLAEERQGSDVGKCVYQAEGIIAQWILVLIAFWSQFG